MSGRPYTEQEDAILRENYRRRGGMWCADKIGRTRVAVSLRARALGVSRKQSDLTRPSNDLIDAVIRRYYTGERKPGFVAACAQQINRNRSWVTERATTLGLIQSHDRRPWTEAEIDFISQRPLTAVRNLVRMMARRGWKRSPSAIAYIRRTGRAETIDASRFTAASLAEAMGVRTETVTGWIKRDLLKATRRGWDRTEEQRGDGYVIHERDVAAFVLRYPAHVSLAKMEPNKFWFLDLLSRHAKSFPSMIRHGEAA